MGEIKDLQKKVIDFRDKRNWKQFHSAKELAVSLVIEASELLENFRWLKESEVEERVKSSKQELSDELGDILYHVLMIAYDLDIDLGVALREKLKKNAKKYPVSKAKGVNTKYDKL
ncbi:MAG TPA: nucleotide pyrophosphohydrolase [Candidatus Sulfotelmatobacter sp.]|nr:nucleotide pyrophosphohydrolase [Candidatus Sulfotelmatobacter sp.]